MSIPTPKDVISAAGGPTKVAAELSSTDRPLTPAAVSNWILRNRVPAEHAVALARLAATTPQHIRPDVFGPPARAA